MGLRGGAGLRFAALLLVALVCADVALDAACEPLRLPAAGAALVVADAGPSGQADECAAVCVSDCFCCSRSETAGMAVTIPPPARGAGAPEPPRTSWTPFSRPVPELPPITFS